MPDLLAYVLLFTFIGAFFIFIHLMMGKLVRPRRPDAEKLTVYECGEPTIGSSWIQFDLRFYVVALLFVIFDVELAFFFPWAVVFGKSNQLAAEMTAEKRIELSNELLPPTDPLQKPTAGVLTAQQRFERLLTSDLSTIPDDQKTQLMGHSTESGGKLPDLDTLTEKRNKEIRTNQNTAANLARFAFVDVIFFFGVLLVGFAYLWVRGDIDWVRSIAAQKLAEAEEVETGEMIESAEATEPAAAATH
jgi:NADH-quinone oxidoreductase subunit A